ncbi:hypothetical protein [Amycolatopsis tucumanensis]|uniref:Uncharacterized protein n=1 Tax=Amycolatopsis tucumanensis TaxID=401106 RepID=A0ABP7HKA5_9PSEU|nr:hypothetical protein [Amycolatopsis tucumanensis]MCF6427025.1 hypothetical protein [Amycolatopsis tucumanensis]
MDLVNRQARRTPRLRGQDRRIAPGVPRRRQPAARPDRSRDQANSEDAGLRLLAHPATAVQDDAAEAARDKITLINHDAAVRLYNLLADRLLQYAALCGDGNAEARGEARTKIEAALPPDGWLGKLLSSTRGKIITVEDVTSLFPSR